MALENMSFNHFTSENRELWNIYGTATINKQRISAVMYAKLAIYKLVVANLQSTKNVFGFSA